MGDKRHNMNKNHIHFFVGQRVSLKNVPHLNGYVVIQKGQEVIVKWDGNPNNKSHWSYELVARSK